MLFSSQLLTQCKKSARKSREKRKAEYAELLTKYNEYLEEIDRLEKRIEALETLLREADIEVLENFADVVVQSISSARNAADTGGELIEVEVDNDWVFREVLSILDNENYDRE